MIYLEEKLCLQNETIRQHHIIYTKGDHYIYTRGEWLLQQQSSLLGLDHAEDTVDHGSLMIHLVLHCFDNDTPGYL